jgi:hypothetical protein
MSYFANISIRDENGENVAVVTSNGELKVTQGTTSISVQTWTAIELARLRRVMELILGEEVKEEDSDANY